MELGASSGWDLGSWPLACASLLIGYRAGDHASVAAALDTLSGSDSEDLIARAMAQLGCAWLNATQGDNREVIVAVDRFIHGVDRRLTPPFLVDVAVSLKTLALIDLGELSTAMATIAGRRSAPGHPVCFELLRATILLRLNEPREALHATDPRVEGSPHNMRSLPSVLLRRAVAYEQLGHPQLADAEFSKSAHLAADLGVLRPAVGLANEQLSALYTRFLARERGYASVVTERIDPEGTYTEPAALGLTPTRLTNREAVLADWLTTNLTLAEISDQLNVSVNTLKTQAKSLYKKVEAVSRHDAVLKLERAGYFVNRPTPHSDATPQTL